MLNEKYLISLLLVACFIIAGFISGLPWVQASSFSAGNLIKASGQAVYYFGTDGKRYVFPNESIFKTWYDDFSSVKVITDAELSSITIGGNVTYRPGSKMVKIISNPTVYAIDELSTLRAIDSEATAQALYGQNWASRIDDISDAYFVNYKIGNNINRSSDFNIEAVKAYIASIDMDKGLEPVKRATSISDAIKLVSKSIVDGQLEEFGYIKTIACINSHGGYKSINSEQELSENGHNYNVLSVLCQDGTSLNYYFNSDSYSQN